MRKSRTFCAPVGQAQILPWVILEFLGRVSWTMVHVLDVESGSDAATTITASGPRAAAQRHPFAALYVASTRQSALRAQAANQRSSSEGNCFVRSTIFGEAFQASDRSV